ncbi:MAG: hypothetical protein ACYCY1_12570 [Sulfuriferula sp.]
MKLNELMKSVLSWAKSRNMPFTTADAYENMKGVDDIKQLSDNLRSLYMGGHLARQKLDGFRYTYALASAGLEGFEIAQPTENKPANPATGETASQPREKTILAPAPGFPKFFREKSEPPLAPAAAPAAASAPAEPYADIGRPAPQRVSYMIDDSGRLDIGDNDTLISLPAVEVKRLVAFLDRVSGLL